MGSSLEKNYQVRTAKVSFVNREENLFAKVLNHKNGAKVKKVSFKENNSVVQYGLGNI